MIALVGMPGGGKSTVGRHLARRLGFAFVDTDAMVERHVGCSIRTFFEQKGEERFRELESQMLAGAVDAGRSIIATGGGVVLRPENRSLLRGKTTCVYLRSRPEELFRRLRQDTRRPLLQVADPLEQLRALFAARDAFYLQVARFVVETGRPSVPMLVNMILMQLELAGVVGPASFSSQIGLPPETD